MRLPSLALREDGWVAGVAHCLSPHCDARPAGSSVDLSCAARAWHAGASVHRGRARCNDFSIGVELEGTDFTPYRPAQYLALAALVPALRARYALAHAAGHSDIAVERKSDPGPLFDWPRLAADTGLTRG